MFCYKLRPLLTVVEQAAAYMGINDLRVVGGNCPST